MTLSLNASAIRNKVQAVAREMDWFRGLRAAVALSAPLVLGDLLGISNLGWVALGGFEAILSDTGGSYRTRLNSLATLSLGGAVGVALGAVVGAEPCTGRSRSPSSGAFCGATSLCSASHSPQPAYWCRLSSSAVSVLPLKIGTKP
jgi:hypothetical protein